MLGVGMMYSSLEAVEDAISSGERKKVMAVLRHHAVQATDYYHALYVCDGCHGLYKRFYVKIEYDNNQTYETVFKCPRCDVILRDTNLTCEKEGADFPNLLLWPCPKCGKTNLRVDEFMLWD